MNNIHYIKDTKKLWQAREKARSALDKKRANVSLAEKEKVLENLRADADFLKSGRIVPSKD
jgi:hypothetical protein